MAPRACPNAIDCVGPAGALNIDSLAQPGSKLRRIRLYLPILVVGPVSPEVSGHRFVANANGSALVPLGIGVDPRVLAVGQPFEVAAREGAVAAHHIPDRVQDGLVEDAVLDEAVLNTVGYVVSRYGALTGSDLERLTHSEDPWIDADSKRDKGGTIRIRNETMAGYFRGN